MILLFLGFPSSWDKIIAILSGLVIVGVAYQLGGPNVSGSTGTISKDAPFADSKIKEVVGGNQIVTPSEHSAAPLPEVEAAQNQ